MNNKELIKFENIANKKLTDEQSAAVKCDQKNILLCARAGTGKTFTLAAKVWHLINNCGVDPDEILVLSFSNKAANEIRERINKYCGNNKFKNARTFDSLACQILEKPGDIVQEKEKEEIYRSLFKNIKTQKGLLFNLKNWWYLDSECNNLAETTDSEYRTLNGENVKSMGEKLIADFLFEHDIDYKYESPWLWNGRPYHPDFQIEINGKTIVWEHWAINPDIKPEKWSGQKINEPEYYNDLKNKQLFWNKNRNVTFLETSIVDLKINNGEINKKHFHTILKTKLTNLGLTLKKLSNEELSQRIYKRNQKEIFELFEHYVTFVQADCLTPQEMSEKIKQYNGDKKIKFFLKFANDFYSSYLDYINRPNSQLTDFHNRKIRAIKTINDKKGDIDIRLDNNGRSSNLKKIKWILIDEYQDFSESFFRIIKFIREYNREVNLFCVGDDWQSINGYAGSNLKYYVNFKEYFGEYKKLSLLTNRRSPSNIVNNSNQLMSSNEKDNAKSLKEGGIIDYCYLFNNNDRQNKATKANYMMAMCLSVFALYGKDKSITFLSRMKKIEGMSLERFARKIEMFLSEEYRTLFKKCEFSTVHTYKGKEADIVVLLGADKWLFPLKNSKFKYFEIFRSINEIVEEEKRLFYVAITRPKHRLVLVADNPQTISPFVMQNTFSLTK